MSIRILHGDCRQVMTTLDACSVDSIVTDPPYELTAGKKGGSGAASVNLDSPYVRARIGTGNGAGGFMGMKWDATGVAFDVETWRQALRVLKPGGHLLAFSGTRTYHRMVCAIEDAGFEIRDQIGWAYGSGFPKSHNGPWGGTALKPAYEPIAVAQKPHTAQHILATLAPTIAELLCKVDSFAKTATFSSELRRQLGGLSTGSSLSECLAVLSRNANRFTTETATALITDLRILKSSLSRLTQVITTEGLSETSGVASSASDAASFSRSVQAKCERLSATTAGEIAIDWYADAEEGQEESRLSPDWRSICMARKPLIGTVEANWREHGTGALNIDGCRVAHDEECRMMAPSLANIDSPSDKCRQAGRRTAVLELKPDGRWPANLIHDGSDEVLAAFPQAPWQSGAVTGREPSSKTRNTFGLYNERPEAAPRGDTGSAARFFYCAKADRADRNDGLHGMPGRVVSVWVGDEDDLSEGKKSTKPRANHHPTVKPTDLMRYLCRLVTPKGGTVLDPFAGSGSTLKAAELEGFLAIGIELDAAYIEIARRRIASDAPLFADVATTA